MERREKRKKSRKKIINTVKEYQPEAEELIYKQIGKRKGYKVRKGDE